MLCQRSPAHLPDMGVPSGRQLVESVIPSKDQRGGATEAEEVSKKRSSGDIGNSCGRRFWPHRVAQGPKVVENSLHPEFSTNWCDMSEARRKTSCVDKSNPDFVETLEQLIGLERKINPQSTQHI